MQVLKELAFIGLELKQEFLLKENIQVHKTDHSDSLNFLLLFRS
jgi:hypothetical protein